MNNPNADATPPSLEWLDIGLPQVNPDGTAVITVTARIVDAGSGLFDGVFADGMGSSPPQVMFGSSSGQVAYGMFDVLNPLSGNRNDGVFQATVTLGSFAQAGNGVSSFLLADEAGNMKYLCRTTRAW